VVILDFLVTYTESCVEGFSFFIKYKVCKLILACVIILIYPSFVTINAYRENYSNMSMILFFQAIKSVIKQLDYEILSLSNILQDPIFILFSFLFL